MTIIECLSIEKLDDVENKPHWRYKFRSAGKIVDTYREVPDLLIIKPVANAWQIGKTYSLEVC